MSTILGYWNIRGLCQPIRFLLEYCGENYEDRMYTVGPPPEYDRSAWHRDARKFGLAFPNLPYYVDGDIKITHSIAIAAYIGRKYGLEPTTDMERTRVDMALIQQYDLRIAQGAVVYNKDCAKLRDQYIKDTLILNLEFFSNFLGSENWICGKKLTYADFLLYEALEVQRMFAPEIFEKFNILKKYLKNFENLPEIKEYMNSSRCIKWPICRAWATWGV